MRLSVAVTRAARHTVTVLAFLSLTSSTAAAQGAVSPARAWEFRVSSGALLATGAQRSQLKDAQLTAAQLSLVTRERLALTGAFSWARSRDRLSAGTPKLDVFTGDIGVEMRSAEWRRDKAVSIRAFTGLGVGARSYHYRSLDVPSSTNVAGYGSLGAEVGIGRVALRLEARDYATRFTPLIGAGNTEARNDVVLMGGFRFNRHRVSHE